MASPRLRFYSKKSYWKKLVKRTDRVVMELLNREVRGDLNLTLTDYFAVANRLIRVGELGEKIADRAVKLGLTEKTIRDIADIANIISMLSERLHQVAEKKWGKALPHFPVYRVTLAATAELVSQSESVRAMQEMVGERQGGK
jgi:hypothetical protein